MSKKLSANEICNLLEVLVGLTEPQAESAIDDKVEQNLKTLIYIGDWVLDGLYYTARHRKDPWYSSKTIGEQAYATMLEWKDWIEQRKSELT